MARFNSALGAYSMDMSVDNEGHLSNPKNLSVTNIVGILEGNGAFERFSNNINPLHWGGVHLEGTLQNVWFHMIFYPGKKTVLGPRQTTKEVDDWSKPPIGVEMHCERGGLRPSSVEHGWDYLKQMLLESWFTSP